MVMLGSAAAYVLGPSYVPSKGSYDVVRSNIMDMLHLSKEHVNTLDDDPFNREGRFTIHRFLYVHIRDGVGSNAISRTKAARKLQLQAGHDFES